MTPTLYFFAGGVTLAVIQTLMDSGVGIIGTFILTTAICLGVFLLPRADAHKEKSDA